MLVKGFIYAAVGILGISFSGVGLSASTSSVFVPRPTTSVYHSDIEWHSGVTVAPSTNGQCPPGSAAENSSQNMRTITHRYVKEVRTNWNNTPIGWNYTSNATSRPPEYGVVCRVLETNLVWVPGEKP